MRKPFFNELKDFDFKSLLADLNVSIEIEREKFHIYNINLKNTSGEIIKTFQTDNLVREYSPVFSSGIKKPELEKMLDENSPYLTKNLRSDFYIAWYDLAINEKNKPAYLNKLLPVEKRRMELYKEIDNQIDKEISFNNDLKEKGDLINIISNLAPLARVESGKDLNNKKDSIFFDDYDHYMIIPIATVGAEKNLYLKEDLTASTGYRGYIGVEINGVFSMKEDISYSKEDEYFNKESIENAMSGEILKEDNTVKKRYKNAI